MKELENPKMVPSKLKAKVEESKQRRAKMRSQFGQFSSFSATELMKEGVVENIKLDGRNIEAIIGSCKFLFSEIKDDGAKDEGGYSVELSF